MTAAHLPAHLDHRDAQRKAATTRAAVVVAVGDAIEKYGACPECLSRLACEHGEVSSELLALGALDAALPHLDDDGIRAVADALLGPEGAMP